MLRHVALLLALLLSCRAAAQTEAAAKPDLTLTGKITGRDAQSYLRQPFDVPDGVQEIVVDFSYDKATGTVIDLGLMEGERIRGWSGGNKARFLIGDNRATPSYLPGPVSKRKLALLLGVPHAAPGSSTSWRADIRFLGAGDQPPAPPSKIGAGWYRGDLHSHTGHSDGSCPNTAGVRVPCPLYRTVEAAARAGLDFIAVTEHNTVSHLSELEALQPAFPSLLLLPGQEVTTFQGHANVIGATALAEFRVGTQHAADGQAWSSRISDLGGVTIINHPGLPTGRACMGCGWSMDGLDWSAVQAVEVMNGGAIAAAGGDPESRLSGLAFWEQRLDEGRQLAPIGASDNHDPTLPVSDPRAIGRTVTIVWADALSVRGIEEGIRRGRVCVDIDAQPGRLCDLFVESASGVTHMGGALSPRPGERLRFSFRVAGCAGCAASLVVNGAASSSKPVRASDELLTFDMLAPAKGWVRGEVRNAAGKLTMISAALMITS